MSLEEASAAMLEKNISCLPILERSGAVVGIVTKTDVLKNLFGAMVGWRNPGQS
jgi:predicted transcriptional regulator